MIKREQEPLGRYAMQATSGSEVAQLPPWAAHWVTTPVSSGTRAGSVAVLFHRILTPVPFAVALDPEAASMIQKSFKCNKSAKTCSVA